MYRRFQRTGLWVKYTPQNAHNRKYRFAEKERRQKSSNRKEQVQAEKLLPLKAHNLNANTRNILQQRTGGRLTSTSQTRHAHASMCQHQARHNPLCSSQGKLKEDAYTVSYDSSTRPICAASVSATPSSRDCLPRLPTTSHARSTETRTSVSGCPCHASTRRWGSRNRSSQQRMRLSHWNLPCHSSDVTPLIERQDGSPHDSEASRLAVQMSENRQSASEPLLAAFSDNVSMVPSGICMTVSSR